MEECIDTLSEAKIFNTSDCKSGYWQTSIEEEDREKTSFLPYHGIFRFASMQFGLTKAPGTFQRAIDIILSSVR